MPITKHNSPFPARQSCKGSALISALFIITLVAIAATAMSMRIQLDIYRTRLTIQSDKIYLASEVVLFWAMGELSRKTPSFRLSDREGAILDFPQKNQNISPNLLTTGNLYDLQGKFNINNIHEKNYYPVFLKLLENVLPDIDAKERENIAISTRQWTTPYTPGRGNDEFMSYYMQQKPPYYPAHQPLQNISELRLIKGVNAKIYQTLTKYITALPEVTPINLNSASKKLLMSLGNGLTDSQVTEIIQARGDKGIRDMKDVNAILQKLNIRAEQATLVSQYYMSIAKVIGDDQTLVNYSVIKRKADKEQKMLVSLISESLNSP